MGIILFILALTGGILTLVAPCLIRILPMLFNGSFSELSPRHNLPAVFSGFLFALLLLSLIIKTIVSLLGIPPLNLAPVSLVLTVIYGISLAFPDLWEKVRAFADKLNPGRKHVDKVVQNDNDATAQVSPSLIRDLLLGFSLAPVFTTCSPAYTLVLASLLPVDLKTGTLYFIAYAAGLIGLYRLIHNRVKGIVPKLLLLSQPHNRIRRIFGLVIITTSLIIIF